MTLITYKPTRNIADGIDKWFNDFWNVDYRFNQNLSFNPEFEITENENSYFILADLPGMGKKDLDISVSDGMITISGERKSTIDQENNFYKHGQMKYGEFEKSFYIPEDGNVDKINAKMINGFLSIEILKSKKIPADIKKISIK